MLYYRRLEGKPFHFIPLPLKEFNAPFFNLATIAYPHPCRERSLVCPKPHFDHVFLTAAATVSQETFLLWKTIWRETQDDRDTTTTRAAPTLVRGRTEGKTVDTSCYPTGIMMYPRVSFRVMVGHTIQWTHHNGVTWSTYPRTRAREHGTCAPRHCKVLRPSSTYQQDSVLFLSKRKQIKTIGKVTSQFCQQIRKLTLKTKRKPGTCDVTGLVTTRRSLLFLMLATKKLSPTKLLFRTKSNCTWHPF